MSNVAPRIEKHDMKSWLKVDTLEFNHESRLNRPRQ